jgi:hypothetical protein
MTYAAPGRSFKRTKLVELVHRTACNDTTQLRLLVLPLAWALACATAAATVQCVPQSCVYHACTLHLM